MRPEEAVDAFHHLGGQHMIPMHYGTYDLSDEPVGEPVRILKSLEAQGKIQGKLTMLEIGKRLPMAELNNKKLRESPSSL